MPIYEYLCSKCGKKFERIQKFSDEPLKVHDDCGGPVERLISASGFHLKGSGWYATDYAKSTSHAPPSEPKTETKKEGGASGDSKPSETKSSEASSTSSESKPAATTSKTD